VEQAEASQRRMWVVAEQSCFLTLNININDIYIAGISNLLPSVIKPEIIQFVNSCLGLFISH
jgi:hypothetical protein